MNKRLGKVAIEGSGPAGDALRRFGLDAGEVAKLGTEGAFYKLVEVMQGIQNPAERAAVAMDLFGKSGQGMINLVARGADGIAASGKEAIRFGSALDSIDSAKVEETNQAFIRLGEATQGFANMIAVQLAPFLTKVIDMYTEWGYSGTKSESWISQGMEWVTTGLGWAVDGVTALQTAFHAVNAVVAEMVSYFLAGIDEMLSGVDWLARSWVRNHIWPGR